MNRSAIYVILGFIVLIVLLFIPWQSKPKLDLNFKNEGSITIQDTLGQKKATFLYQKADDDEKRELGLMHRKSLEKNHSMLFIMDEEEVHSFWMVDTYIPLDIIFINEAKEVVFIAKSMEPESQEPVNSKAPCLYALEINAGLSEQLDIQVGDVVAF